ncbi:hypothetical protein H0264_24400 [Nocardia huaxiensis]|uniref:Uncharacterized protein n=1 Tax=Nocardia huaxiensis TaxID=2755382 RepID=A0A7D6VEU4_9NOCA|nr:hypothetical protein [Nocardia huaxiensis]QLY28496.1 hypothetical protein H0264_24400 [Nocardia huaxiensis]
MTASPPQIHTASAEWFSGSFEPTPQAARLSGSPVFEAGVRPATARFAAYRDLTRPGAADLIVRMQYPGSAALAVLSNALTPLHASRDTVDSITAAGEFEDGEHIYGRLAKRFRTAREYRLEDRYGRVRWAWLEWHPYHHRTPALPVRFLLCAWFTHPEGRLAEPATDAGTRVALGTLTLDRVRTPPTRKPNLDKPARVNASFTYE